MFFLNKLLPRLLSKKTNAIKSKPLTHQEQREARTLILRNEGQDSFVLSSGKKIKKGDWQAPKTNTYNLIERLTKQFCK